MTPGEASAAGKVLIIDHPEGGRRIAAHVFDIEGGIAFLDSGWTEPVLTSHTAHVIEGEFLEFALGWGYTREDGHDIFIEIDPQDRPQEGSRTEARSALEQSLHIDISE